MMRRIQREGWRICIYFSREMLKEGRSNIVKNEERCEEERINSSQILIDYRRVREKDQRKNVFDGVMGWMVGLKIKIKYIGREVGLVELWG